MIGYIYKCTFNEKIYIGESFNAINPNYLGKGKLWNKAIQNHKDEVNKEILEIIEHEDRKTLKAIMHKREIYWISYYDSTNPNIGYNISPGGNLMAESSLIKMKESDSRTMKKKMEDPELRRRISEGLKKQRRKIGMSDTHKANLSKQLKNRNIGCNGDSRSIQVYCEVDGNKYYFHNKIEAAKWWYENYPFSEKYAEITYTRMITKSINNQSISYYKKPITNIKWYLDKIDTINNVFCTYNTIKYEFDTIEEAIKWWHNTYPIQEKFDYDVYYNKLIKSIKGFVIERHSRQFNNIHWYRKELL